MSDETVSTLWRREREANAAMREHMAWTAWEAVRERVVAMAERRAARVQESAAS